MLNFTINVGTYLGKVRIITVIIKKLNKLITFPRYIGGAQHVST